MIWQGKLLFFYLFIYSFLSQAVNELIARTLHRSLVDVPIVTDGLVIFCGEETNSESVVSIKRFQFNVSWNLSFGPLTSYNQKVLHMSETRSAKAFDRFLAGYP
jgi:fructose-bisphosphate aldolase class 1